MHKIVTAITLALIVGLCATCGGGSSGGSTLTGIDISPISPNIVIGDTQQFHATGHFSDGPDQDLTANSNWTSSVTSVATIQQFGTQPGLATGVAAGTTNITASFAQGSSSVTGSTNLTVTTSASSASTNPDATAWVYLVRNRDVRGSLKVDGTLMPASGSVASPLTSGVHHFESGSHRFAISLLPNTTYIFQMRTNGELALLQAEEKASE